MSEKTLASWVVYVYLINGSLSMLSGSVMILIYLLTKSFKEAPGMLILWHVLSQTLIDSLIAYTGFSALILGEFPDCRIFGCLNTYFYFLGFNYSFCLCAEVIQKIQHPMQHNYNKRAKLYHISSHTLGIIITLVIALNGEIGESGNHFCLIKSNSQSKVSYLIALPLALYFPALILTVYIICKRKSSESYMTYFLIKHSVYVIVYFSIWCPVIIYIILRKELISTDDNYLSYVSVATSSSSGLILSLMRISSYFIIKKFKNHDQKSGSHGNISIAALINDTIKVIPQATLLQDTSDYTSDYFNMFKSLSTESALTSIIVFQCSLRNYSNEGNLNADICDEHFSEKFSSKITLNELDLLKLPKSLKAYCKT